MAFSTLIPITPLMGWKQQASSYYWPPFIDRIMGSLNFFLSLIKKKYDIFKDPINFFPVIEADNFLEPSMYPSVVLVDGGFMQSWGKHQVCGNSYSIDSPFLGPFRSPHGTKLCLILESSEYVWEQNTSRLSGLGGYQLLVLYLQFSWRHL